MRKIITISYTGLDAPGGVPRWNRDFISSFKDYKHEHFCWDNFPFKDSCWNHPEHEKAKILNLWLLQKKLVNQNDIIIADGFWLDGLEHFPYTVSVCHGIWGHITKEDVDAGKQPDFPINHAAQVAYRQKLWNQKKRMVAVSDFIADNMKDIWGWEVPVINTGIDLNLWQPHEDRHVIPVIVHGVNDKGNINKGWDHIEAVRASKNIKARILSFDEFAEERNRVFNGCEKHEALGQADLCLIPSNYEGNSLFCLEALACNVPIVAYDVGLPYLAKKQDANIGIILDRNERSKKQFTKAVESLFDGISLCRTPQPREWVSQFSIENFRTQWRNYIKEMIK